MATKQAWESLIVGICGLDVIYTKGIQSILVELINDKPNIYINNTQQEMIQTASNKHPDIVLIKDWDEPKDFPYVVQRIHEVSPKTKILVFISDINNPKSFISVCESHVDAILEVSSISGIIEDAISTLINGNKYISSSVAKYFLNYVAILLDHLKTHKNIMNVEVLSMREKEIFDLIRKGRKNHEIALHLNISVNTVHNHIVSINKKLGLRNKRELSDTDFIKESSTTGHKLNRDSNLDGILEQLEIPSYVWIKDRRYTYNPK